MNVLWYLLWFVIAVGLLVTVHEFGHFWVARRLGFKVLRFSVGFGKPIYKRVAGADKVEYVIGSLPLGGYVKMLDEREGPVPAAELARSFTRRPPWQRIAVLLAGPLFNIVFAVLLLWAMTWANGVTELRPKIGDVSPGSIAASAGIRSGDEITTLDGAAVHDQREVTFGLLDAMSSGGKIILGLRGSSGEQRSATIDVSDSAERHRLTEPAELFAGLGFDFSSRSSVVAGVVAGGPAQRAGLLAGDSIVAIDGVPMKDFHSIVDYVSVRPGQHVAIDYRRGDTVHSAQLDIGEQDVHGKRTGRIGVESAPPQRIPDDMLVHRSIGPVAALSYASAEAWNMTALQGRLFWRMLIGKVSVKNLSGPLSIAEFAGESAHAGPASFLGLLVLLSLSLGFLNLLPIPILDGGQIVFQAIEWLKGSPLSERAQVVGQQLGIALLIVLMSVALYNDIARQFG